MAPMPRHQGMKRRDMAPSAEKPITIELADEAETAALAIKLAAAARPNDVLSLIGDLGAGKTVFARAFINARAAATQEVPSPTFTLVQTYAFPDPGGGMDGPGDDIPVYHFDLFRIEDAGEIEELGMEDAFAGGISLIEWPDRLNGLLPVDRLDVTLTQGKGAGERRCVLTGHGSWAERLSALDEARRNEAPGDERLGDD